MNAAEHIADLARQGRWGARTAYVTPHGNYSHGWVHESGARLASVLRSRGTHEGHRVILCLPEGVHWVIAFLALARCGALAVCVDPDLPEPMLRRLASRHRPDLVLTTSKQDLGPVDWASFDIEDLLAEIAGAEESAAARVTPRTPLYVQFSSGTTGESKGAVHTHSDLAAYHRAVGEWMLDITAVDRSISSSKIYRPYGFGNLFVYPLHSGSSAVLVAGRQPADVLADLATTHGATIMHAIPSVYMALMAEPAAPRPPKLRVAVSAGEPLAPSLNERIQQRWRVPLLNELGSTEAGGAYCANTIGDNEPGTIGRPLPGYELSLRDRDGMPVDSTTGLTGNVWLRGATVMLGYLDDPALSASVLVDGWLATADRAAHRPDGRYVHLGRSDDVEVINGGNISPADVEQVFCSHPAVREVAVAGRVEDGGRRELWAFVVLHDGWANDLDPGSSLRVVSELSALARQELASHEVPSQVRIVPSLPRSESGKLMRRRLRGGWPAQ